MITLSRLEFKKIFQERIGWIVFLSLFILLFLLFAVEVADVYQFNQNTNYGENVLSWKEREETLISYATEDLRQNYYNDFQKEQIQRRIAIAEYRLEHDIEKNIYKNIWWFFHDNLFSYTTTIVCCLLTLIGSIFIAGEYGNRSIRQIALLPLNRHKILFAKLLAFSYYALILLGIVFFSGFLSGLILHGTIGLTDKNVLFFGSHIITIPMGLYCLLVILLKLIEVIFYLVCILLLCVFTRSPVLSVVLSLVIVLLSSPINFFLGSYYRIFYYLPFSNLDFRRYLDFGTVMPTLYETTQIRVVEGIGPFLSACIVILSTLILLLLTFRKFKTQEL